MKRVTKALMAVLLLTGHLSGCGKPAQADDRGLLSCYVLGDSIAVGTAQQLPWCWSNTHIGLNTQQALRRFTQVPRADVTVISLGINDRGTRLPTEQNLAILRARLHSPRVIWILPPDAAKSAQILVVAGTYHDRVIDLNAPRFERYLSHVDHIHPNGTGYALVAHQARALAFEGR